MAKKVILAVAGAGKTYYICHKIDPNKRNLILAFTHENIYNIQKELCDAHGGVPKLTMVSTFDSFVYHNFVLPYEPSIVEHFGIPGFVGRAIQSRYNDFYASKIAANRGEYIRNTCLQER